MRKILLTTALLICITLSLSSCAKNYKLDDLFDDESYEVSPFTDIQHLPELDGTTPHNEIITAEIDSSNLLLTFKTSDSSYIVYDVDSKSVVRSFNDVSDVYISTVYTANGVLVHIINVINNDGSMEIYQKNGEYVATVNNEGSRLLVWSLFCHLGLFQLNDKVYRVNDDGSIDLLGSSDILPPPKHNNLPRHYFSTCANGYYYSMNESSVDVYNSDFELTASWKAADSNDECNFLVLSNGNVLIQVDRKISQDTQKYTYATEGGKYILTSYVMNPKNGKIKTVDLDYKILKNYYITEGYFDNKSIKNVVAIIPIENKLLDDQPRNVSLKNNGKIDGYLFGELNDYNITSGNVYKIAENVVLYETKTEEACFVDLDGKVLHTFDSYDEFFENLDYFDEYCIVVGGIVYDWSFTPQYDLAENGLTMVNDMSNCIILKNENENTYYRCDKNGNLINIGNVNDVTIEYNYYVVKNADVFEVHNHLGENVANFGSIPDYIYGNNKFTIISVNEDGDIKYYLLTNK